MTVRIAVWMIPLLGWAATAVAQPLDPHRIYEEKCSACHQAHAGDFVSGALVDNGQEVVGRNSGQPARMLFDAGHGSLTPAETDALLAQFSLILGTGRVFKSKCRICHENAVDLARRGLILEGETLTGRYSGRDIETFLRGHGRLTPSEVDTMVDVLKRALETQETAR